MIKFFLVCVGLTYWLVGYTESHIAQKQVSSVKQNSITHSVPHKKDEESGIKSFLPTLRF